MNSQQSNRPGFSLLEVLIACGILVIGLSSIAAILPAAASRLSEATAMDRAAATAAIAMSEVQDRGLASREMFSVPGTNVAVVFGEMMPGVTQTTTTRYQIATDNMNRLRATTTGSTMSLIAGGTTQLVLSVANAAFVGNSTLDTRGFVVDDDLVYGESVSLATPVNAFTLNSSTVAPTGTTGFRAFNNGLRWGGLVIPEPWGVHSGSMTAATVSIAVFRKLGTTAALTLTETGAGTGVFITGSAVPASVQRSYLRSCTSVLAIPPPSVLARPQWLKIRSSWVPGGSILTTGTAVAFVVFEDSTQDPSTTVDEQLVRKVVVGGSVVRSICVIGFDSLLLVDEKRMPIR